MRVAIDANTVLSGLFFHGNERELLLQSLDGEAVLIFAEDVVEEVYAVIQETFRDHPDLKAALELLSALFHAGELVPRRDYREGVEAWKRRIRDASDAPLVAAAIAAKADCLVTGDKDLLVLEEVDAIPVLRARAVLERIGQRG